MSRAIACEEGAHDKCLRRSCDCFCGHPARLSVGERERLSKIAVGGGGSRETRSPRVEPERVASVRSVSPQGTAPSRRVPRKPRPSIVRVLPAEPIIAAYSERESMKSIGARYGVSHHLIRRLLTEHDVPIRKQGDRSKPIDTEELILAYLDGESCESIGPRVGLSASGVVYRLKAAGVDVDPSGRRVVNLDVDVLVARYESGDSIDGLASQYECGSQTIRARLLSAGVRLRSQSEAARLRCAERAA